MRCYRHPDRETYISCSDCGRPICTECMTPAPVGQRCPEHSGQPQGVRRVAKGARRNPFEGTTALVTKGLIALNVLIYVITAVQGNGINSPGGPSLLRRNSAGWYSGSLFAKWVLYGPAVANGDWWRLITSAFLHANLIHIAFNMYFLWFVGSAVESALGRGRFIAVYLISGLAGSAGALVFTPTSPTVGASGALFGLLGAALVLERQRSYVLGGSAAALILINLILSFSLSNISVGGHIGGLIGGVILMWLLLQSRRSPAQSVGAAVAVIVASIVVAYAKVRGYS